MNADLIALIAERFSIPEPLSITPLDAGLVNVSYKVQSSRGNFVLQKLSPIWDERVIADYQAVQQYLRTNGLHVPVLLMSGKRAFQKVRGKIWRAFEYQHNDFVNEATPDIAYEAGKMLGTFHALMNRSSFTPRFTLPGFHDTPRVVQKLERLARDPLHKAKVGLVEEDIVFLTEKLPAFYLSSERFKTIIHGDPKLANFLFKDRRAVSLLDLDTMMKESPLFDVGDALRSWCRKKPRTAHYDPEIFEFGMKGYNETSPFQFTYQGVNDAMSLVTLELAARYLNDYFEESYFSFKSEAYASRAEQNLARSRRYRAYQQEFAQVFRKFHVIPFVHSDA